MKFKQVPPPSLGYVLIVYHVSLFLQGQSYIEIFFFPNSIVKIMLLNEI